MKRSLAIFLIALAVAMPVLACCCPQDDQANAHADQHHDHTSNTHSEHDCSRVDLQTSNQPVSVQTSDLQSKVYFDLLINNEPLWNLALPDRVRNTPLIANSPHTRPVFLTTLRLRI